MHSAFSVILQEALRRRDEQRERELRQQRLPNGRARVNSSYGGGDAPAAPATGSKSNPGSGGGGGGGNKTWGWRRKVSDNS